MGDADVPRPQLKAAHDDGMYDFFGCFDEAQEFISADLAFANYETTMAEGIMKFLRILCSTRRPRSGTVGETGFDVCTANNHCVDKGKKEFLLPSTAFNATACLSSVRGETLRISILYKKSRNQITARYTYGSTEWNKIFGRGSFGMLFP